MSKLPEVDLSIFTGKLNIPGDPLYYITVEVTSATGIVPDIFVVSRSDKARNSYDYSRVASILDIQNYGTSPVTDSESYRVSTFTIKTNSLSFIKEFKEGVQVVVQDLLDSVVNSEEVSDVEQVTVVKITGGG